VPKRNPKKIPIGNRMKTILNPTVLQKEDFDSTIDDDDESPGPGAYHNPHNRVVAQNK
jgi:hypothetical protein